MKIKVNVEVVKRKVTTDGIDHNIYAVLKNGLQVRQFNNLSDDHAEYNLHEYLELLKKRGGENVTITHITEAEFLASGGMKE